MNILLPITQEVLFPPLGRHERGKHEISRRCNFRKPITITQWAYIAGIYKGAISSIESMCKEDYAVRSRCILEIINKADGKIVEFLKGGKNEIKTITE